MRETLMGRPHRGPLRCRLALLGLGLSFLSGCNDEPGGTRGGLRVRVVDQPVSANPVSGALVRFQGQVLAGTTNASGYAMFSGLPAGDYVVLVSSIGYCSASHPATVTANSITDLVLPLCPAPGSAGETGPPGNSDPSSAGGPDIVSVPTTGAQPGLLLFDAAAGGSCLRDQLVPGQTEYPLLVNALPPGSSDGNGDPCPTSVTLFTPAHGLRFTNAQADLPWTADSDNLTIPLPPKLNLPLAIWVAPGVASAKLTDQIHSVHLKWATAIFDAAGAGLALVDNEQTGGDPVVVDIPTNSPGATLFPDGGTGCDNAAAIMAEPSVYQVDKLNIYYVPKITGLGTGSTGYYCYLEGAPAILFISGQAGLPHILAHELGHALGLLEPNWGHTHDLGDMLTLPPPGSAPRNFMAYGAEATDDRPYYATLGQAFRMNFSPLSWANLPGSGGPSLRQRAGAVPASVGCPCPATDTTDDCPALILTGIPPDYLTAGPGWEPACAIVPNLTVITLCAGQPQVLEVSFATSKGGVTLSANAQLPHFWSSDNPAVIAIDSDKTKAWVDDWDVGWASVSVVGAQVGLANVTLLAGGPSASAQFVIDVKSCP